MKQRLIVLTIAGALGLAVTADAATFGVTATPDAWDANPGDGVCDDGTGACPLRAAIMEANELHGHDTIALNGLTYVLDSAYAGPGENFAKVGDLDIRENLSIVTRHGAIATIDAGEMEGAFHVLSDAVVDMSDLVIRDAAGQGGVRVDGTLTMTRVRVTGGWAQHGGGIYVGRDGILTFTHGRIDGNEAGWQGGGLFVDVGGTAFVDFSTISGNVAWGGGGLATGEGESTTVIHNTTFSGNSTDMHAVHPLAGGGAIRVAELSSVHLTNVTVSGNAAEGYGAGILVEDGKLGLIHTLITDNRNLNPPEFETDGSGLYERQSSYDFPRDEVRGVWMVNTVIAGNHAGASCVASGLHSLGHNVDDDGTCHLTAAGDQPASAGALLLGPLQYNGGPARTHALLAGNPARDAADDSWCPSIDQRKHSRPVGAACDVGPYEVGRKSP